MCARHAYGSRPARRALACEKYGDWREELAAAEEGAAEEEEEEGVVEEQKTGEQAAARVLVLGSAGGDTQ